MVAAQKRALPTGGLVTVPIPVESLERFRALLEPDEFEHFLWAGETARELLSGRIVWNVNSTAQGGGVAEMLRSLLPLVRGAGVPVEWVVIRASEAFFRLTKQLHNRLHGAPDGGALGDEERALYGGVLAPLGAELASIVAPGDVVVLHDPQTAGLVPAVREAGVEVVWRCHIGVDEPNGFVKSAWRFLLPYVAAADACVFSRAAYVWEGLDPRRCAIIPPSIDAFSPKNQHLTGHQVTSILCASDVLEGRAIDASFVRTDGTRGFIAHAVDIEGGGRVPEGVDVVTQVSRWDRLKDPSGVLRGFVEHVLPASGAHLVLAGPKATQIADDPEGVETLCEVRALWSTLPGPVRERVHLVSLPMVDLEENAAIVNALQRRSAVVVQKSLAEGFGLTVTEAMWKARPMVASRVGGIRDQIQEGISGLLVEPTDLAAFGQAVTTLLSDSVLAARLGRRAHQACRDRFLAPRHLIEYVELIESLRAARPAAS